MASYEDVKEESQDRRFPTMVNTWIGWVGSFSLSLAGGLILSWWELKYHPTNDHQWMVPLGLILFVTPVIVWFSVFISDFCNSSIDPDPHIISTQNSHKMPCNDPET